MAKIFISYRRVDSNAITSRIYDRFAAAFGKNNIFKDVDNIPPGRDFRGVVRVAAAQCQIMLVVIGQDWVDAKDKSGNRRLENPDDFVRIEVETGLQRDEIIVIPVLVEGAHMPSPAELPDSLRELVYNNAFTIHDDPLFHRDMDTLIRSVNSRLGRKRLSIKWFVVATMLLAIAIAAGVLLPMLLDAKPTETATLNIIATILTPVPVIHPTLSETFTPTNIASATSTLIPTPSETPQPTLLPSETLTFTRTPTNTGTPTSTNTSTAPTTIKTGTPVGLSRDNHVTSNVEWKPYIDQYARTINGIEMVLVPAGCFDMGSMDFGTTRPVHQQCFDMPFYISRYEITNAEFDQLGCTAAQSSIGTGALRPRENINWVEARDCASKLEQQLGGGWRLPTEAEWEYAARGPDTLFYPWGNNWNPDNLIWMDNSDDHTSDVGSKPDGISWVGANDMAGNVWEWTSSIYKDYAYIANDGRENNDDTSSLRVLRGGSFSSAQNFVASANRRNHDPYYMSGSVGFRLVVQFPDS